MAPLEKLRELIHKGYLIKEIKFEGLKIKLSTLSTTEEYNLLEEAGLASLPSTEKETLKFLPVLASYIVKEIDGEAVVKEQSLPIFLQWSKEMLLEMFEEYMVLIQDKNEAAKEIKN